MSSNGSPSTNQSPRKRPWFQFSLRTLLLAMAALGFVLAPLALWVKDAVEQQREVDALIEEGAIVEFGRPRTWYQRSRLVRNMFSDSGVLDVTAIHLVVRPLCDEDCQRMRRFTRVTSIVAQDSLMTDAGIAALGDLQHLEELWILNSRVTDAGLASLAGLTKLRVLVLLNSEVTGEGLVHARGLKQLARLDLTGCPVTDAIGKRLSDIPQLEDLNLNETRIGDAGAAELSQLTQLKSLALNETQITDAGLAFLGRMPRLEQLQLEGTQVSDAGLAHLRGVRLFELLLSDTKITDTGMTHLSGQTELRFLALANTQLTDAGLAQLTELENLEVLDVNMTGATEEGACEFRRLTFSRKVTLYLTPPVLVSIGD